MRRRSFLLAMGALSQEQTLTNVGETALEVNLPNSQRLGMHSVFFGSEKAMFQPKTAYKHPSAIATTSAFMMSVKVIR